MPRSLLIHVRETNTRFIHGAYANRVRSSYRAEKHKCPGGTEKATGDETPRRVVDRRRAEHPPYLRGRSVELPPMRCRDENSGALQVRRVWFEDAKLPFGILSSTGIRNKGYQRFSAAGFELVGLR